MASNWQSAMPHLARSLAENGRMRAALQQMIDSMPCGVLVLDTAETIVMINPEGRRLLELGERACAQPARSLRDQPDQLRVSDGRVRRPPRQ